MIRRQKGGKAWFICAFAGFVLANFALFLHPMSPQDFLGTLFSDPVATFHDERDLGTVVVFWCGALMALFGLAGTLTNFLVHLSGRIHAQEVRPGSKFRLKHQG